MSFEPAYIMCDDSKLWPYLNKHYPDYKEVKILVHRILKAIQCIKIIHNSNTITLLNEDDKEFNILKDLIYIESIHISGRWNNAWITL